MSATQELFDLFSDSTSAPKSGARFRNNKVARIRGEIQKLSEDLNQALYSCRASDAPTIHHPDDAFAVLQPFMGNLEREELWLLSLNIRNRVMKITRLYAGSLNSSHVRMGDIFHELVLNNAASFVVAHNHPSGDPTPSPDDISLTKAIVEAGKLMDLQLLDHIIIAGSNFISLKEKGLGF